MFKRTNTKESLEHVKGVLTPHKECKDNESIINEVNMFLEDKKNDTDFYDNTIVVDFAGSTRLYIVKARIESLLGNDSNNLIMIGGVVGGEE